MTLRLQNLMLAMLLALSTLLLGMNNPIPNVPKIGVLAGVWVDKAQNGQSAALSSEGILQRHWAMTQFQKYAQAIDVASVYGSSEQVLYAVEMAGHDTDLLDLDVFSDVSNAHLDVFFGGDQEAIHQILAGPTALGAYAVGSAMWGPSGTRPAALPSKTPTISEGRLPIKGGEATNRRLDVPSSSVDLNISQADLISIQSIQPGKSSTVTINGTPTLVTKGADGRIIDATPISDLPTTAVVPSPLQPPAPSDPWWAKAIKQLEGVMDDL